MELTGPAGEALRSIYLGRLGNATNTQIFLARRALGMGHATSPDSMPLASPTSGEKAGLLMTRDPLSKSPQSQVSVAISTRTENDGTSVRLGDVSHDTGAIEVDAGFQQAVEAVGGDVDDAKALVEQLMAEAAGVASQMSR